MAQWNMISRDSNNNNDCHDADNGEKQAILMLMLTKCQCNATEDIRVNSTATNPPEKQSRENEPNTLFCFPVYAMFNDVCDKTRHLLYLYGRTAGNWCVSFRYASKYTCLFYLLNLSVVNHTHWIAMHYQYLCGIQTVNRQYTAIDFSR